MARLPLRDDLRLKDYAVELGYEIEQRSAADPITFRRKTVTIWNSSTGWRARDLNPKENLYVGEPRLYGLEYEDLKRALEAEVQKE